MLTVFEVTSTAVTFDASDGVLTFPEAIQQANGTPNGGAPDEIHFNIPTSDPGYDSVTGTFSIKPTGGNREIWDAVIIDGWTQPGWSEKPLIELDGTNLPFSHGLTVLASDTIVRGLIVNRFGDGIAIYGGIGPVDRVVVQGNYIGLDATGTQALGNGERGVSVFESSDNVIGTNGDGVNDVLERNIISGNGQKGVEVIEGSDNWIAGNFIGTDVTGTVAIGNGYFGVTAYYGALRTRIGTNADGIADEAERNIISGNPTQILIYPLFSPNSETVVAGNYIGTDVTGTLSPGGATGIQIAGSRDSLIGTNGDGVNDAVERNVISGNVWQIYVHGIDNENVIAGNYIGTDASGTVAVGGPTSGPYAGQPTIGILFDGSGNRIGTDDDGIADEAERNVISGNDTGINVRGSSALIAGNSIGIDAHGSALGNTQQGVTLEFNGGNNQIGGEGPLANTIAHNGGAGIEVGHSTACDNSFRGNSIYSNGGLGIDLGRDAFGGNTGVTPNDLGDADTGPNNLQNFPVLNDVSGGATTHVAGSLNSLAHTSFIIDFYANTELDPSGYGEGERWLGSANAATGADGNVFFDVTLSGASSSGEYITATATDPNGNTSEFSGVALISNLPPTADAGGLYLVGEGGQVVLDGAGSTDPDQSTGSLTFEWDLDGDSVYGETGVAAGRGDEVGSSPTFSAAGLDGFIGSSVVVGLWVTDDQGDSDADLASIAILNLHPSADNDASTVSEDGPLVTIDVLDGDTDPAGLHDPLAITSIDATGTIGLVSFTTGTVTYDPNGQFESLSYGETAIDVFAYSISDNEGGTATALVTVTIIGQNDRPVIIELNSSHSDPCSGAADGFVSINGSFSDVDLSDSHTVRVEWGDGSPTEALAVDQIADTFLGNHSYSTGGIFTITVTIDDGNGGTDTLLATAVTQGIGFIDGVLFIIGTEGRDHVNLKYNQKKDELKVDAKLNQGGSDGGSDGRNGQIRQTFQLSAIDRIVSYLCEGDDHYNGGSDGGSDGGADVVISQFVFGGGGDDHITGGRGNDVLTGGSGSDDIQGGSGLDILIGGIGKDKLQGGRDNDLLLGGSAANQDDLASLYGTLAAFVGGDLVAALLDFGALTDDGDKDDLKGQEGIDCLIGGFGDHLKQ